MYRIIKIDGTELGITDSVNYIKIGESGSFTITTEKDAIGIAFDSVAYNLAGHTTINGAETVVVSKIDSGQVICNMATYSEMANAIREGVNAV